MTNIKYQIDIIGDIHGYADKLKALLTQLGYEQQKRVYTHSERRVIFIGDYIDRGPDNFEVVHIVRSMTEKGMAQAIMGNHEYNAICFHTTHPDTGRHLRQHSPQNKEHHHTFLKEYDRNPDQGKDVLNWFKTLPMATQVGSASCVHACWDETTIIGLKQQLGHKLIMTEDFIISSSQSGTNEHKMMSRLLKGPELYLKPYNAQYHDQMGTRRRKIRIAWWHQNAKTLRDIATSVPDITELPETDLIEPPFRPALPQNRVYFFGHYWMIGQPKRLTPTIACVDYSVANNGYLTAYQWRGETELDDKNFNFL